MLQFHVTPKTSSTSLHLKNLCPAETGTEKGCNSSGNTGASEWNHHQITKPNPDTQTKTQSSSNKPKKNAGKQRKKTARSVDVFCCLHVDAVSVLPLAWQAAPACFINTAQAALDENPRFTQVQLHSGELHHLQCTDKPDLPGLRAPKETFGLKEAGKRNYGINVRSQFICCCPSIYVYALLYTLSHCECKSHNYSRPLILGVAFPLSIFNILQLRVMGACWSFSQLS